MLHKINLPKWLPLNELIYINSLLKPYGELKLVGGCVREILLNSKSNDIDLATTIKPENLIKILNDVNVKTIPTGIKHGTITAIHNNYKFEITTLRQDVENYGRHARVEFTDDWRIDAERRDFTFNAMYLDLEGNLYDYFNGLKDLQDKLVRFIGDPLLRIKEDYLRILRYFRFYAYLGGTNIDQSSLKACEKNLEGLINISGERINSEMMKILSSPSAKESIMMMDQINLLPAISLNKLKSNFKFFQFSQEPIANLASLILNGNMILPDFQKLSSRWKLSNHQKKILNHLCFDKDLNYLSNNKKDHKIYIYKNSFEIYNLKHLLHKVMNPSGGKTLKINHWINPQFPIDGNKLLVLGFKGVEIGKTLKQLENKWCESDFKLSEEELLNLYNLNQKC